MRVAPAIDQRISRTRHENYGAGVFAGVTRFGHQTHAARLFDRIAARLEALRCVDVQPFDLAQHARGHSTYGAGLLREAHAAAAVGHPNVVEILDVFELDADTPVMS